MLTLRFLRTVRLRIVRNTWRYSNFPCST